MVSFLLGLVKTTERGQPFAAAAHEDIRSGSLTEAGGVMIVHRALSRSNPDSHSLASGTAAVRAAA
jgi:predicted ATP-dependent protease